MNREKVFVARPMRTYKKFNEEVDIIVPFRGQYEKVTRLIESLYKITVGKFNLILVDDASNNNEYVNYLSSFKQIKCIRSEEHVGFSGALKLGYENSTSNWIVFMNSDVEIIEYSWLRNLGECYLKYRDNAVKMVSAKNNNPCGIDEMLWESRNKFSEDYILKDGEHISLECVFFHKDLFNNIGGFLKNYFPGWYEDEELAYRMNRYKFKQAICGNSFIFHHGQSTIKEMWKKDFNMKELMESNREKCIADVKSLINSHI